MPTRARASPSRFAARQFTYSTKTTPSNDSENEDYETPVTSAMATPAAELISGGSQWKGKARSLESFKMPIPVDTMQRKRKRQSGADAQLLADQLLAQKLQEEEYDEDDEPLSKQRRFVKKFEIENSPLSELLSDENYEEDSEDDFVVKSSKKGSRTAKAIESRIVPTTSVYSDLETESEFDDSVIGWDNEDEDQASAADGPSTLGNENAMATVRYSRIPTQRNRGPRLSRVWYRLSEIIKANL